MSNSFEKSVKGGTKIKLACPKAKYVEHILLATRSGDAGVAEVFRTLQERLRDSTWTIVFKALIIVHLMIKEGERDVTLKYLATSPKTRLAINTFTDVQTQGQNIRRYSNYLLARAEGFRDTKVDYVQPRALDRLRGLTIDKGLLRESSSIQDQIKALLKCDFFTTEPENEIALMAFRLITKDLLDLFAAENQAVMNILSHYFELSKVDAERAVEIYKVFCKQTDQVVQFLSIARQYEHVTRLEIPKIKHAPTSLVASLQEYLDDNDFDINRRQYLAESGSRNGGGARNEKSATDAYSAPKATPAPTSKLAARPTDTTSRQPTKGPAPDMIDFFGSIEQNQQPMAQQIGQQSAQQYVQPTNQSFYEQQYPQQTSNGVMAVPQQTNPYTQAAAPHQQPSQLQTQFTGAGFGGYGPQPQQDQQFAGPINYQPSTQPSIASPVQQQYGSPQPLQAQSTNPFRQSMMMSGSPNFPAQQAQALQQQSTNPFAKPQSSVSNGLSFQTMAAVQEGAPQQQQQQQQYTAQPLQAQQTGTNPFARPQSTGQQTTGPAAAMAASPQSANVTGSTNPFRQSAFVNQQTGQGWQTAPQASVGGWEQLPTVPVFPRPGQGS